ncbi:hypothetical protein BpHYR1_036792, partial [Brachionus plicatilis]
MSVPNLLKILATLYFVSKLFKLCFQNVSLEHKIKQLQKTSRQGQERFLIVGDIFSSE